MVQPSITQAVRCGYHKLCVVDCDTSSWKGDNQRYGSVIFSTYNMSTAVSHKCRGSGVVLVDVLEKNYPTPLRMLMMKRVPSVRANSSSRSAMNRVDQARDANQAL